MNGKNDFSPTRGESFFTRRTTIAKANDVVPAVASSSNCSGSTRNRGTALTKDPCFVGVNLGLVADLVVVDIGFAKGSMSSLDTKDVEDTASGSCNTHGRDIAPKELQRSVLGTNGQDKHTIGGTIDRVIDGMCSFNQLKTSGRSIVGESSFVTTATTFAEEAAAVAGRQYCGACTDGRNVTAATAAAVSNVAAEVGVGSIDAAETQSTDNAVSTGVGQRCGAAQSSTTDALNPAARSELGVGCASKITGGKKLTFFIPIIELV